MREDGPIAARHQFREMEPCVSVRRTAPLRFAAFLRTRGGGSGALPSRPPRPEPRYSAGATTDIDAAEPSTAGSTTA